MKEELSFDGKRLLLRNGKQEISIFWKRRPILKKILNGNGRFIRKKDQL